MVAADTLDFAQVAALPLGVLVEGSDGTITKGVTHYARVVRGKNREAFEAMRLTCGKIPVGFEYSDMEGVRGLVSDPLATFALA